MRAYLFDEFGTVTAKQWKQKIQMELQGADYNETLIWQSIEGIHVKPFYHPDDFAEIPNQIPGQPNKWRITQSVFIDDERIANQLAIDAITRGAEAIIFTAEKEFHLEKLFAKFPFQTAAIYFEWKFLSEDFIKSVYNFLTKNEATVYYNLDLIGNLARTGNWHHNLQQDHSIVQNILSQTEATHTLSIDTTLYQNAGANLVQQLAYGLAHANEYLNYFSTQSKSYSTSLNLSFKISIGPNYFFEIAKIRALRSLFALLAKEYDVSTSCHIIAQPSKRNKTLYDYNINMLRTTTESMAAIIGGADAICNLPYDVLYHKSNEFGERIARNQLLILKNESYLEQVSNPADGAYYIESLTKELSEKSLQIFKEIELKGGFLKQLKEGTIQRKIGEAALKEQLAFDQSELVLVGTNKYVNAEDKMNDELELFPFMKFNSRKTIIQPIIEKRWAEQLEQERLKNE